MTKVYVNSYVPQTKITDFLVVKESVVKQTKTGKNYAYLTLADKEGTIPAKKWDLTPQDILFFGELNPGEIIKVRGMVDNYNGENQLVIELIRKANKNDKFDIKDIIKAAPLESEKMYDFIFNEVIGTIADAEYRKICETLYEQNKERIMYWPAGKAIHHDEFGGFLWHIYRMSKNAMVLTELYPELNRSLLLAGVVLHDIGKLYEIESTEFGVSPGYTDNGMLLGHLVIGTMIIGETAKKLKMTSEKKLLLEHLVATHHGKPEWGALHKPCVIEAYFLHHIDMLDMYAYVQEHEVSVVEPGSYTDRIYACDNQKLYNPISSLKINEE